MLKLVRRPLWVFEVVSQKLVSQFLYAVTMNLTLATSLETSLKSIRSKEVIHLVKLGITSEKFKDSYTSNGVAEYTFLLQDCK